MSKQCNQNQKQDIINRYFSGVGVTTLSKETGVSRSTIYNWLKVERQIREKKEAEKEGANFKSYSQKNMTVAEIFQCTALLVVCISAGLEADVCPGFVAERHIAVPPNECSVRVSVFEELAEFTLEVVHSILLYIFMPCSIPGA